MKGAIVLLCVVVCFIAGCVSLRVEEESFKVDAPLVQVQTYEMSKCPYCSRWKQRFNQEVFHARGVLAIMNLTEYWVGKDFGNNNFECLHGAGECVGNKIISCATALFHGYGWWNLSVCMQTNNAFVHIPDNAYQCVKSLVMDWNKISACANGTQGDHLLSASFAHSAAAGVAETPTTVINGKYYIGGAPDPLRIICDAYTGTKPAGCKNA
eukprot:TRINITY_DN24634_c0_g1_i1.p1 TRINITY_DN24634_c0_g1~~TRINITY_DN24634_c0_g1_i1.p1  ORF type:complete len:224 (-),score=57.26 TRINITY_DN24634_c0_g1_i1:55-687(-)